MPVVGGGVVLVPEALDENTLPSRLLGRDDELARLVGTLRSPVPRNGHAWLHGPAGCGRTCLARHAIEAAGLGAVHVNCRTVQTAFRVLDAAVDQLRLLPLEFSREREVRLRALRAGLRDRRVVFLLDDADALHERELEYLLHGLAELPNVSVLVTAAGTGSLDAFQSRNPSHFLPLVLEVRPLGAEAMAEALADRARVGIVEGAWSSDVMLAVARAAAGDGRLAVQALRRAANFAEFQGLRKLDERVVATTLAELRNLRRTGLLGQLTQHHRVLFKVVCDRPGLSAGDVRREEAIAARVLNLSAIAERTIRKYLNDDLVRLGLLRVQRTGLRGNVFRYWPVDLGGGEQGAMP